MCERHFDLEANCRCGRHGEFYSPYIRLYARFLQFLIAPICVQDPSKYQILSMIKNICLFL
jgi:hypothetical protein